MMTAVSLVTSAQTVIKLWPNGAPEKSSDPNDEAELTVFKMEQPIQVFIPAALRKLTALVNGI